MSIVGFFRLSQGWYVHTEMFIYLDAMMSAAGERAAAEARKEQQEELQQQHRQLEHQKQQQQQQLEHQRKQLEQQQNQLAQQKGLEQDKHQGSNAAHDEQQSRRREGTIHGASHPKKEGRHSSPAPRKDAADEKASRPADNREAVTEHASQQAAAEEKQERETGGEQAARPAKTAERVRSKWSKQEAPEESEETSPRRLLHLNCPTQQQPCAYLVCFGFVYQCQNH